MYGNSSIVVVENGDEFKTSTESFKILPKGRDSDVVRVFKFRDRTLRHIESTGQFSLTERLPMTKFVEPDLFEGVTSKFD